jgi:hypothetical protein
MVRSCRVETDRPKVIVRVVYMYGDKIEPRYTGSGSRIADLFDESGNTRNPQSRFYRVNVEDTEDRTPINL